MITQRQSGTNSSNSAVSSKSPQMTVTKRNRTVRSFNLMLQTKQKKKIITFYIKRKMCKSDNFL